MHMFTYNKAVTINDALSTAQKKIDSKFLAGGTTLLDLMKLNLEQPSHLIDINHLPLTHIKKLPEGKLSIGALVRNADCAHDLIISKHYSVLSQALLQGASAQLRNKATMAGNLLQRTRCMYFRNEALPCNKRLARSGCPAIDGQNRSLAILGTSSHCIATNASDMNVALAALEANIEIQASSSRIVNINDFFLLPKDDPQQENMLQPGELITSIVLPAPRPQSAQVYIKLRDRASYEFALASAAVILEIKQQKISYIRLALGGVATKPWRSYEAEEILYNQRADIEIFKKAAQAALSAAVPQSLNSFKIELAKRCIIHALTLSQERLYELYKRPPATH